jgi:hypothetical protein
LIKSSNIPHPEKDRFCLCVKPSDILGGDFRSKEKCWKKKTSKRKAKIPFSQQQQPQPQQAAVE